MTPLLWSLALILLLVQCCVLANAMRIAGSRTDFHVYRFYNPVCWFGLFYLLWFVVPQVVLLCPEHFVLGMHAESPAERLQIGVRAQLYLILFLGMLSLGVWSTRAAWPSCTGERPLRLRRGPMKGTDQIFIFVCFVIGTAATLYLGAQLIAGGGMRSQLVKTTSGKLLTIVAFFGNFAFAVLFSRAVVQRKYLIALATFLLFGGAVFFTGARGRFMFPLLLSFVYIFTYREKFNYRLISTMFVVSILILVFSDILLLMVKDNQEFREASISELFTKRNFDGFANFCVISGYDQLPAKPSIFWTGARQQFMEHYFPQLWATGVGFGSTLPGMSWLAGGLIGMLLFAFSYGFLLGSLNAALRRITNERLFWAYLFSMVWICAVGGNWQESLDKMMVAASPGFLWWAYDGWWKARQRRHAVPEKGQTKSTRAAWTGG